MKVTLLQNVIVKGGRLPAGTVIDIEQSDSAEALVSAGLAEAQTVQAKLAEIPAEPVKTEEAETRTAVNVKKKRR